MKDLGGINDELLSQFEKSALSYDVKKTYLIACDTHILIIIRINGKGEFQLIDMLNGSSFSLGDDVFSDFNHVLLIANSRAFFGMLFHLLEFDSKKEALKFCLNKSNQLLNFTETETT